MSIRIRPFQESDTDAVVSLWISTLGYSAPHNEPHRAIREKVRFQGELFFVAIEGGVVVGTVMGGYDGHRGWIYSLAVSAKLRRQGIGTSLMEHVERALEKLGCPKINLQVLTPNKGAVEFYKKLGYSVEERINMGKLLEPSE